ncbi:uncharacterized protein JCM15063_006347 [Sporobolomyces koalae]|uniref:uncharacterized protein n=1 Tax=Sporobolomyces koalae TaxID=500713 RepID=UPI00317EEB14
MSDDYQQRYEAAATGYPPVNSQSARRSRNSRASNSAPAHPPHLAHSRYSSADLYAIQQPVSPTTPPPGASAGATGAAQQLLPASNTPSARRNNAWNDETDDSASDSDRDDEGEGFGTYRDFNTLQRNSRRSQVPTLPAASVGARGSTYQLDEHSSLSVSKLEPGGGGGAYETVALPKISRDWDRGEGLDEKNNKRFEKSRKKRKEMNGIFAEYYHHAKRKWKIVVPVLIAFFVALILILYFCIPRTPSITFRHSKVPATVLTSSDEAPYITSVNPVSYYFNADLVLGIDASKSYVPVHYDSFGVTVKLRETGGVIGRTVWDEGEIKVPGKRVTSYQFPIYFSGNYTSTSDPTFAIMKSCCAHQYPTTYRAPLNLTVEVESKIKGVIGTSTEHTSIANVDCPIQWSSSAN